jgi:hypothetical protein
MWLEELGANLNTIRYHHRDPGGQLKRLIQTARGKEFSAPSGYRGALPADEAPWVPVDPETNLPAVPRIIAVDGSQIYPDPAEPLPWAYAHAMVTDPSGTYLAAFLGPDELLREKAARGRKYVDNVRFSLELLLAARVAAEKGRDAVVLLDGPILPPGRTSSSREGRGKDYLDRALSALDDAVAQGGVIAGFTPNGHASYLANLLLAMAEEDNLERQIPLIDRKAIQSLIGPSQRTALFKRVALDNREVTFFYTLQGRVEFPFLPSSEVTNRVWECIKKGYPAELTAAHYLTVIPNGTADYLKAMVRTNVQEASTEKRRAKRK